MCREKTTRKKRAPRKNTEKAAPKKKPTTAPEPAPHINLADVDLGPVVSAAHSLVESYSKAAKLAAADPSLLGHTRINTLLLDHGRLHVAYFSHLQSDRHPAGEPSEKIPRRC